MQFLKRSRIFSGEKGCCRIARVFESGMKFIESGQHGRSALRAYESLSFFKNVTTGVRIQSD
jgi:hypothetical protein